LPPNKDIRRYADEVYVTPKIPFVHKVNPPPFCYALYADAKNELLPAVEEVIWGGRFVSEPLRSPNCD